MNCSLQEELHEVATIKFGKLRRHERYAFIAIKGYSPNIFVAVPYIQHKVPRSYIKSVYISSSSLPHKIEGCGLTREEAFKDLILKIKYSDF